MNKASPQELPKSAWMEVMSAGQFTRDPVLRTKTEIQEDRALAEALDKRRRDLFPELYVTVPSK